MVDRQSCPTDLLALEFGQSHLDDLAQDLPAPGLNDAPVRRGIA
jgi:hypothetical protein